MGNRAIIKAAGEKVGLYLHWNGGNDSVGVLREDYYRRAKDESAALN